MAPEVGIEPTTRGFGDRRSTTELHRQFMCGYNGRSSASEHYAGLADYYPLLSCDAMLQYVERRCKIGRSRRIRTLDLWYPKPSHYQAVLYSDKNLQ